MLSLIVCSVNPDLLATFKVSVANTIGIEYEMLTWDNRGKNQGLASVYNNLALKAKFPFLCFLHEDLLFETDSWGKYLFQIFEKDPTIGLVGVAGGKYKSKLYSGWYAGKDGLDFYNISHHSTKAKFRLSYPERWENSEESVATIDGVFMACPQSVWKKYRFNGELLKGFHFYDIDFSLRIAQTTKIVVTNKIEIIHLNEGGDYGDKWVEQAFLFHNKERYLLPFAIIPVDVPAVDILVAKYWLDWLKNQKISWKNKRKWIKDQRLGSHKELWYSIIKFLFYRPLRAQYFHHLFKKNK